MAEEVYESDLINMVIGTHMSIAKGIVKTAENVVKMNADTMQIFSRNPHRICIHLHHIYDADFQQESAGIEL